ncbi:MAG: hypothetical protein Q8Q17_02780 [bacterium]|nr:hypothetical protein [bacterium]
MNKAWFLLLFLPAVFWFYTSSGARAIAWIMQSYKRRISASLTAFAVAVLVFMYFRP